MKRLLMILMVVSGSFAGKITGVELVSAPSIPLLNEKLSTMVTEYMIINVSEPVQVGNEICVTVSLGTPGLTGIEIMSAPSVPLLNTAIAAKASDYYISSVSAPSQLTIPVLTGTKPANPTKQICVTVCLGKE